MANEGLRAQTWKAAGAIAANTLVKMHTTAEQLAQHTTADLAGLVVGVALDTTIRAGDLSRAVLELGQVVELLSDGAGAVSVGDGLTSSTVTSGRVAASTSAIIARAIAAAPATADARVRAVWLGSAGAAAVAASGTVTSVGSGTGLTGGPITTAGSLALANTAVTPGTYTLSTITVDQQGRITSASSGAPPGNQGGATTSPNVPYASSANTLGDTVLSYTAGSLLFTYTNNGLVTETPGLSISNTTASTSSVQQWSAGFEWVTTGWRTNTTAASQLVKMLAYTKGFSAAQVANADFILQPNINAAGYASGHGNMLVIRPLLDQTSTGQIQGFWLSTTAQGGTGTGLTNGGRGIVVDGSGPGHVSIYGTQQIGTGVPEMIVGGSNGPYPGQDTTWDVGTSAARWITTWTVNVNSGAQAQYLRNGAPDSNASAACIINNTVGFTGGSNGLKLISVQNNATEKGYFDFRGAYFSTPTSLGTAQTVGLSAGNLTAAAAGAQQFGGLIESSGFGWDSTATASKAVKWGLQLRPIQTAGNPASDFVMWRSTNAGAYTEQFKFTDYDPIIGAANTNAIVSKQAGAGFFSTSITGMLCNGSSAVYWYINSGQYLLLSTTILEPNSDGLLALGEKTLRWNGVFNKGPLGASYNRQSATTYTVLATDFYVGMSNVAARTVTLPAASALPAGGMIWVMDEANTAATANVTINRAGSDTINGGTSTTIILNSGSRGLISDGVSKWFVITSI